MNAPQLAILTLCLVPLVACDPSSLLEKAQEKTEEDRSKSTNAERKAEMKHLRQIANAVARQVLASRQVYTKHVVQKMKGEGVPVGFSTRPEETPESVPLPATFVHLTTNTLKRDENALHQVELLSLWNINPGKGWRDEFERDGLKAVAAGKPLHEGLEGTGEATRYRAIFPDVASADACVDCHNAHPKSPKTDFKRGDVIGGILVSMSYRGALLHDPAD